MERDYKKIEEEVSKLYDGLKYIAINEQISIVLNVNKYIHPLVDYIYICITDELCGDNYDSISKYRHQNEQRDFEIIELVPKKEVN